MFAEIQNGFYPIQEKECDAIFLINDIMNSFFPFINYFTRL